jgi:hypothetical protein
VRSKQVDGEEDQEPNAKTDREAFCHLGLPTILKDCCKADVRYSEYISLPNYFRALYIGLSSKSSLCPKGE